MVRGPLGTLEAYPKEFPIVMSDVLLVGQAPSANSDPEVPLSGASGRRLASLAGLPFNEYLHRFGRTNLINEYPGADVGRGDKFSSDVLSERARGMLAKLKDKRLVFMGNNVREVFAMPSDVPMFSWRRMTWLLSGGVCTALCSWMPHPSDVHGWYRVDHNEERAGEFMRSLLEL